MRAVLTDGSFIIIEEIVITRDLKINYEDRTKI